MCSIYNVKDSHPRHNIGVNNKRLLQSVGLTHDTCRAVTGEGDGKNMRPANRILVVVPNEDGREPLCCPGELRGRPASVTAAKMICDHMSSQAPFVSEQLCLAESKLCWCSLQQPNFWELTQSTISSQSTFLLILIKEHSFPFRAISTRPDTGCSLHTEISSSAGTCSGRTMPFKAPS